MCHWSLSPQLQTEDSPLRPPCLCRWGTSRSVPREPAPRSEQGWGLSQWLGCPHPCLPLPFWPGPLKTGCGSDPSVHLAGVLRRGLRCWNPGCNQQQHGRLPNVTAQCSGACAFLAALLLSVRSARVPRLCVLLWAWEACTFTPPPCCHPAPDRTVAATSPHLPARSRGRGLSFLLRKC